MNGNKRPTVKLDSQFTVPAIMKAAGRLVCSNSSPVRMKGIPPDKDTRAGYALDLIQEISACNSLGSCVPSTQKTHTLHYSGIITTFKTRKEGNESSC